MNTLQRQLRIEYLLNGGAPLMVVESWGVAHIGVVIPKDLLDDETQQALSLYHEKWNLEEVVPFVTLYRIEDGMMTIVDKDDPYRFGFFPTANTFSVEASTNPDVALALLGGL